MEEEDETVLFAGSPLHQSLVSSGISLSDTEVLYSGSHGQEHIGLRLSGKNNSKHETFRSILRRALMKVQTVFRILFHVLCPLKNEGLDDQSNRTIVYDLLQAKVLDDDDREFLENYLEDMTLPTNTEGQQLISWKSKLLLVFLVPSLTAYGYQRILELDGYDGYQTTNMDVLAAISSVYLLIFVFQIIGRMDQRRKLSNKREAILGHARSQLSFLKWMKKCLRLIQETELIARGFTLVSQKSPISLIEQGQLSGVTSRQCPELRKLLFFTVREAIMVCRERTKSIITLVPVSSDVAGRYLAFQALESYGPCLQKSASEEMELYDITDGFSVAALKGMIHLCHLHQSEFIKRLIITFDYSYKEHKGFCTSKFLEEITSLTTHLQEWSLILEKSYSFHNSYLLNQEPREKGKVTGYNSPCRDICIAVHSLDLHLQAALTRVRCLNSWLEKLDEESQSVDSDFLSYDAVVQMMQPIKAELDSCKGCWEEGINRIDKLQKSKPNAGQPRVSSERPTAIPQQSKTVNIIQVEDPIIVDQVFEAYTDESHVEQRDYSWEQPLTAEEKEKKKREKQESLRMLKELKSVISVRSQEMEKREADALNRFRNTTGAATTTNENLIKPLQESPIDRCQNSINTKDPSFSQSIRPPLDIVKSQCDMAQTKAKSDKTHATSEDVDLIKLGEDLNREDDLTESSRNSPGDIRPKTDSDEPVDRSVTDLTESDQLNSEHRAYNHLNPVYDSTYARHVSDLSKRTNALHNLVKQIGDSQNDNAANHDNSDDFLNISGGTSQKSLKICSLHDREIHERTDGTEEGTVSDKSSSFVDISNTDVESVYSAISFENTNNDLCEMDTVASDSENENFDQQTESDPSLRIDSAEVRKDKTIDKESLDMTLEERLQAIHGANLSFTSNVAALAAAKSRAFGIVEESTYGCETFGDDSDDEGESDIN